MDRVNRRFLVASTFIAIPAALLMASLSVGTNPEISNVRQPIIELVDHQESDVAPQDGGAALAFAQGEQDPSAVQQVIGKQIETPKTRGIFDGFGRSSENTTSTRPRSTATRSGSEPRGLFDAWFGGNKSSSSTAPRTTQTQRPQSSSNADWDGVPYHEVERTQPGQIAQPIRNQAARTTTPRTSRTRSTASRTVTPNSSSATQTRVIRGGSGTPVAAAPTPVRRLSKPTVAQSPKPALQVPSPPTDRSVAAADEFSTESSSRRSKTSSQGLRVDSSNVAKIYSSAASDKPYQDEDVADLVPRVSRRVIRTDVAASKPAPAATPAPAVKKVEAKPAAKEEKVAKAEAKPAVVPEKKPEAKPEPKTEAVAKVETSTKVTAPDAPAKVEPQPQATLAEPTVAQSKPAYNTPVDPTKTAVPAAPPEQLGVPAASVSHRAGPAASSFGTTNQTIRQPASVQYPAFDPSANADNFSAIGSGVRQPVDPAYRTASRSHGQFNAPHGYDATHRGDAFGGHNASPAYGAPNSSDPYGSPYGYQPNSLGSASPTSPGRLTTSGQPVQSRTAPEPSANDFVGNRPAHETIATPFRPIPGYTGGADASATDSRITRRSSSEMPNADNFSQAGGDDHNQMRGKKATVAVIPRKGANIVASELPGIRVITHGPAEVMIRQDNEYEIRVENRGSIDAHGVLVRAMIPDWAEVRGRNASRGEISNEGTEERELLLWTIDHLPAGTSEQLFVRLVAARSGTYNLDVDWTLVPQKSVAQVKVHEPLLNLIIEGPEQVIYGSSQTYKVRVLNPGDGIAPNVVFTLSPNSATPQSQSIGDIPPGKEAQFEVELTAQDLGDLKIQGLAVGDLELRAEAAKTIRVSAANLEAVLAGPELKYQNTPAVYNLQVQNLGSATSDKVMATLRIPAGVEYLGGIEGATFQRGTLKWEITSLPPSGTRDYQFECNMKTTGDHMFAFDCKGTAAGQAQVAIATRVESIADLVLTINDPPAPAPIASDVTYEIVVRNRGSREAKNVRAIAQFSHGIEPLRVEGQSGEVVTGQVLFDEIPRIGAGEEVVLRVIAQAEKAGHHRFRTEVRSGDTVLVAEEATHYMSPRSDRVSRRSSDTPIR
ncbi:hypothetical protein N9N28_10150 [Rubripirellula amarantea]|nr:hypothetical protein [Rubripirellula amarantea]